MAYVAGDLIKDDEFNTFVGSTSDPYGYNHFAGTGAGVYGLGQTEIGEVSGGSTTVTAAQFNSLITGIINIANHTNDSPTARTQVTTGDTIAIKSAVAADLATLAASVAGGSVNATALTTSSALQTTTTGSEGWDASATIEQSVTFANAARMRHFFNAGGKIRVSFSIVAAATSSKDTAFANLCTSMGNIDINSLTTTRSGSGETLTTNGLANGQRDLGTGYTEIIKLTSDNSGYTSNTLNVSAKLDAAVDSSVTMTVKMIATDPDDDGQFTSGNTDGIAVGIKDTPKMVMKIFTITPDTNQGLGTSPAAASSSAVSNSTS